ncbi:MAG: hypothetical protein JO359_06485 [Candidatus Eremiobacteraeota bacterium]|nr:hypothetical protein [Candidatus Eremiobacteraeota bacterium]
MYFLLFYDTVENFVERRAPHRAAHLAHVDAAFDRGEIKLAGALGTPPKGAALLFECADPSVAENFAKADPYVAAGLVLDWRVEPWHVVVGEGAIPR